MDAALTVAVAILSAAAGAIASAVATRHFSRRRAVVERDRAFDQLSRAREVAWRYLINDFSKHPRPFRDLMSDKEHLDGDTYSAIASVLRFWLDFSVLAAEREIDKRLAISIMGYNYSEWHRAFLPLYIATVESDEPKPDWAAIFESKGRYSLDWLLVPAGGS